MKNVLVVGGAGYLGGSVLDHLERSGYHVRVYDSLLYEDRYMRPSEFMRGDVRDTKILAAQVQWSNVIVWLAAIVGDKACALDPTHTRTVNETALVEALPAISDRPIVFASTCSVYGARDGDGVLDECSDIKPLSLYGETKWRAEKALRDHDTNARVLRFGTLCGASDRWSRPRLDLAVNAFAARAAAGLSLSVHGGNQIRPFVHVRDAAAAVVRAVEHADPGTWNITAQDMTIFDVVRVVRSVVPDVTVKISEDVVDARSYAVTSQRAIAELGWRPWRTVGDAVKQISELVHEGRIRDVDAALYANHRSLVNA